MGLKLKPQSNKDFSDLPPEGDHFAACVAVVDLGTHARKAFDGGEPEDKHMVFVAWELVDLPDRPVVGKDFTASLHEKAKLRIWLKKWRGKDLDASEQFDVKDLVGKKCQLTITHKPSGDRSFVIVEELTRLRTTDKVKDAEKEAVKFDLDDDKPFRCPEWMPYLYGKSIEEWVDDCQEKNPRHTSRQASTPPPTEEEEAMGGEDNGSIPF